MTDTFVCNSSLHTLKLILLFASVDTDTYKCYLAAALHKSPRWRKVEFLLTCSLTPLLFFLLTFISFIVLSRRVHWCKRRVFHSLVIYHQLTLSIETTQSLSVPISEIERPTVASNLFCVSLNCFVYGTSMVDYWESDVGWQTSGGHNLMFTVTGQYYVLCLLHEVLGGEWGEQWIHKAQGWE